MAYPGTKDPVALTADVPVLDHADLRPEPLVAADFEVFNAMIEVDDRTLAPLIPAMLWLPLPPVVTFVLWQCADSSIGPFKLAQLRVATRLVARSRGLLLASYFEGAEETAAQLRSHWGFSCTPGSIDLRIYYDRVVGTVEARGRPILRIAGMQYGSIAPADIRDMANCNPIRLRTPEGDLPRLLQVDNEFAIKQATRSIRPVLEQIDGDAWNAPGLRQEYPVRALHYNCEFRLPAPRYMIDPALPGDQKSEEIH